MSQKCYNYTQIMNRVEWWTKLEGWGNGNFGKQETDPMTGVKTRYHLDIGNTPSLFRGDEFPDGNLKRFNHWHYAEKWRLKDWSCSVEERVNGFLRSFKIENPHIQDGAFSVYLDPNNPRYTSWSAHYSPMGRLRDLKVYVDEVRARRENELDDYEALTQRSRAENLIELGRMFEFDGEDIFYTSSAFLEKYGFTKEMLFNVDQVRASEFLEDNHAEGILDEFDDLREQLNAILKHDCSTENLDVIGLHLVVNTINQLFEEKRGKSLEVRRKLISEYIDKAIVRIIWSNHNNLLEYDRYSIRFGLVLKKHGNVVAYSAKTMEQNKNIGTGSVNPKSPTRFCNYIYEFSSDSDQTAIKASKFRRGTHLDNEIQLAFPSHVDMRRIRRLMTTESSLGWEQAFPLVQTPYIIIA